MLTMILIAAMLIAFAASLLAVPVVRRLAVKQGWIDTPDLDRKLHRRPTPNLGGLAVFAGFLSGLFALLLFGRLGGEEIAVPALVVLGGSIIMVGTGLYDDIRYISFRRKFLVQLTVAYLLLLAGFRIEVAGIPFFPSDSYSQALLSVPLTMIWIVGVINAVNLLDGLDGLASGVAMIAFGALAIIFAQNGGGPALSAIALIMIGALAGFLVYNFTPASIFLGDSGSLFIGYMLAVFSLMGPAHGNSLLAVVVPVVVLGLPILDTTLCVIRRLMAGKSPYSADRDHIHHRLDRLFDHKRAVTVMYLVAVWFAFAGILISLVEGTLGIGIAAITLLAAYVGVRTLGYLDVSLFTVYRQKISRQLSLDFESVQPRVLSKPPTYRRTRLKDVAPPDRTLPVRLESPRAPWRHEVSLVDGDEVFLRQDSSEPLVLQINRDGNGYANDDASRPRSSETNGHGKNSDPLLGPHFST